MYTDQAFNPTGWDAVLCETIRKEGQLKDTSYDSLRQIKDLHGGHPPAGWAWFGKAGSYCIMFSTMIHTICRHVYKYVYIYI